MHPALHLSPEIAEAMDRGQAVVALESTIIAHGMPYPQNVETARAVEDLIRREGAVPATIAVFGGRIHVGLSGEELEQLGTAGHVAKVSRRDLPHVLATGALGATTVAGTMIAARLAGIRVFVTGGIGGVHRGAETSFDISADLQELAQTPVAVVCAGAKSILDLGLTLEYLETHGVPVIGYGTERFPAFFTRDSGLPVDFRLDEPAEVARLLATQWSLGYPGGAVVANPIPEADAMDKEVIDAIIGRALGEAARQGVTGKRVTPFLLDRIKQLTGGRSLAANIALVEHNAVVGARIALALQNISA
ncbi:MAG TPA: pseudouridine-5'-phosphate glycosidase [Holophaga sp.]|nr:pseudouridine-5'-phosphate glycosidase [Holophaga sp.]HPS67074.1 pseudouridine-5'-phosphate glycosidase [Holophaga sp.]